MFIKIKYVFDYYRSHNDQKDYIDRRGIHVVVGHYIGDSVDPLKTPNITKGNECSYILITIKQERKIKY